MGRGTVHTGTLHGIEAVPVEVQADVGRGLPSFTVVGLPDAAVQEAKERVRSALRASGFEFPSGRVLLNLAPGRLRKRGTGFDLPMAAAILLATGQVPGSATEDASFVGELSLDGTVRSVHGVLAHARTASALGRRLVGPPSGRSGASASGADYWPLECLSGLRDPRPPDTDVEARPSEESLSSDTPDLAEVVGQPTAKRALEVCAAGAHGLMLQGPPGTGKTLLARCLCGILPEMCGEERVETALVHSVAGLDSEAVLAGMRPFRSPHHSCSAAGLVGGGSPPRPGEVSLAHNGVLFLDEMSEFGPSVLQTLRQPLEDGRVVLVRADGRYTFPARITLVAAVNPCPCGHHGDRERPCTCAPATVARHRGRIGGPLLDRIDVSVRVDRIDPAMLVRAQESSESSSRVRERVMAARRFSAERSAQPTRDLSGRALLDSCDLSGEAASTLADIARSRHVSGRGVTRLLRVARSVADLESSGPVKEPHVLEALSLRLDGADA